MHWHGQLTQAIERAEGSEREEDSAVIPEEGAETPIGVEFDLPERANYLSEELLSPELMPASLFLLDGEESFLSLASQPNILSENPQTLLQFPSNYSIPFGRPISRAAALEYARRYNIDPDQPIGRLEKLLADSGLR